MLCHLFCLAYQIECLKCCGRAYMLQLRLFKHLHPLISALQNMKAFDIPPLSRSQHYKMTSSWWWGLVCHHPWSVVAPLVLSWYYHWILKDHSRWQYIWRFTMLESNKRSCTVSWGIAREWLVFANHGSRLFPVWDSCMLVSLSPDVCETLKNMRVLAVLHGCGFSLSSGYVSYCHSQDVIMPQCTSSWFPYNCNIGEESNVPLRSLPLTGHYNAHVEPIGIQFFLLSPGFSYLNTLTRYWMFGCSCVDGCQSTNHLRYWDWRCSWKFLWMAILTHMRLLLKARRTETF